jgi:hypothetical protein
MYLLSYPTEDIVLNFVLQKKKGLKRFADDKGKAAKIRLIEARLMGRPKTCAATFNIILQRDQVGTGTRPTAITVVM